MSKLTTKATIAALALAVGMTGAAQAGPFNIWTASQMDSAKIESVRHRHYRHRHHDNDWDKAAFALGTIGAIAGAAAYASRRDRYYYDDGYYDGGYAYGPSRYYYEDDDYCDDSRRPKHYPAPQGC